MSVCVFVCECVTHEKESYCILCSNLSLSLSLPPLSLTLKPKHTYLWIIIRLQSIVLSSQYKNNISSSKKNSSQKYWLVCTHFYPQADKQNTHRGRCRETASDPASISVCLFGTEAQVMFCFEWTIFLTAVLPRADYKTVCVTQLNSTSSLKKRHVNSSRFRFCQASGVFMMRRRIAKA